MRESGATSFELYNCVLTSSHFTHSGAITRARRRRNARNWKKKENIRSIYFSGCCLIQPLFIRPPGIFVIRPRITKKLKKGKNERKRQEKLFVSPRRRSGEISIWILPADLKDYIIKCSVVSLGIKRISWTSRCNELVFGSSERGRILHISAGRSAVVITVEEFVQLGPLGRSVNIYRWHSFGHRATT